MLKNKFLKHTVACFAVFTVLSMHNAAVFADVNGFSPAIDGKHVSISYEVPGKGYGTLIYVFDTKVTKEDVINEAFLKEHLVYQTLTSENTVDFTLPESETKLYTVIFGGAEFSGDKMDRLEYIFTVSQEETGAALDVIKASSGEEIYDAISLNNDQVYSVDISKFAENKQFVADVFEAMDYKNSLNTVDDLKMIIDKVNLTYAFKDMSADEIGAAIKENGSLFGIEEILEGDIPLISKAIYDMHEAGESLDTLGDIKIVIKRGEAVYKFNAASNDERLNIIRGYSDIFGIDVDEDDVEKVSERELNKLLGTTDITAPEDLIKIYSDAMDKLIDEANDDNSGNRGGGSKGSGGGGGVFVATPTLEPEEVDEIRGDSKLYNDTVGYEWADEAIKMLNTKGVMTGDGSGFFRPADPITREEFVKIVVDGFGLDKSDAESVFSDVPSDAWYAPYVMSANASGIVSGMGDGTFGTGTSISRQDAAVILTRACELKYKEFTEVKSVVEFTDYGAIAEYAHYAVSYLGKSGILNGYEDGSFKPLGTVTRAEAAKLVYGCIK